MNLLIVEDSKSMLESLKKRTKSFGFKPIGALTKAEGIERYHESQPEIVLLDVALPDGSGFEVAEEIRIVESLRETYRSFVIFLTGLSDEENIVQWLQSGGDVYLPKSQVSGEMSVLKAYLDVGRRNIELQSKLHETNKRLHTLAFTDALTGIYNRRMFDIRFDYEWNRAVQSQDQLSVIIFDVDHFKAFNDTYGHPAGDECLAAIGKTLKRFQVHGVNVAIARYGGEEFVLLLPGVEPERAQGIAHFILREIANLGIPHQNGVVGHVTASFWVATAAPGPGEDRALLLKRADAALYVAKERGRNRVELG